MIDEDPVLRILCADDDHDTVALRLVRVVVGDLTAPITDRTGHLTTTVVVASPGDIYTTVEVAAWSAVVAAPLVNCEGFACTNTAPEKKTIAARMPAKISAPLLLQIDFIILRFSF